MEIKIALGNEFNAIRDIAQKTWPVAYGDILSREQLDYMMEMMYSEEALEANVRDGVHFILAWENGDYFGFGGFEHGYKGENRTHIHKIYVLPSAQGKNVGRQLMQSMQQSAFGHGSEFLTLNVNRNNSARIFYEKLGFEVVERVDIAIGNGYLMEDFVMRKTL